MPTAEAEARPFVAGIILAAGASTRMGRAKQLLPLEGRPLLQHVLDAAVASCLDEIILVLGHQARTVRAGIRIPRGRRVRVAFNRDYALGQSTSLQRGLRAVSPQAEAIAILLADQPRISAQLIDTLATAFRRSPAPAVRPVYTDARGRPIPGHPVFLSRQIWPQLEELRGDEGARTLLAHNPQWLFQVPVEGPPPADIDSWEDYLRVSGEKGGYQVAIGPSPA